MFPTTVGWGGLRMTPILNFVRWAGLSPAGELGNKEGRRSHPRWVPSWTEAVRTEFKEAREDLEIAKPPPPRRRDVSWEGEHVWSFAGCSPRPHPGHTSQPVGGCQFFWTQWHCSHPRGFPGPYSIRDSGTHAVRTQEGKTD